MWSYFLICWILKRMEQYNKYNKMYKYRKRLIFSSLYCDICNVISIITIDRICSYKFVSVSEQWGVKSHKECPRKMRVYQIGACLHDLVPTSVSLWILFWLVLCSPRYRQWLMCASFSSSVKSKRRYVGPNPGFISQLCLYETMNWQLDKTSIQFRMYRLQVAADQVKKGISERINVICLF